MAKYLDQSHAVLAPEIDLEGCKPVPKTIDLSALDTVDTLPDFRRVISDSSFSSKGDVRQDIEMRIRDAAQIEEWCPDAYEMVKTLQLAPRNQGRVDLMRSVHTGSFAAVKRMPSSWMKTGPNDFENAYPESNEKPWIDIGIIKYLHEIGFKHVCEPWGVFSDGLDTYVVSSYASEGELFSWLERDPAPGPERETALRPIMRQLFSAMKWLHDHGIAHCDLSLENVLLTDQGSGPIVKLIDFGMASLERSRTSACGKRSYMAPEMYLDDPFDVFATDAFALGVVAFGVCCREYPWNSTKPGTCKLFDYVNKNGLQCFLERRKVYGAKDPTQRLAAVVSKPLQTLLIGLLQMTPEKRMTLGEVQAGGQQSLSVWSHSEWLEAVE